MTDPHKMGVSLIPERKSLLFSKEKSSIVDEIMKEKFSSNATNLRSPGSALDDIYLQVAPEATIFWMRSQPTFRHRYPKELRFSNTGVNKRGFFSIFGTCDAM